MAAMSNEQIEQFKDNVQDVIDFDATFIDEVVGLLETLGYTLQDGDQWILRFTIQGVETEIKEACNVSSVPAALENAAVKRTAGQFLITKKDAGELQGFSLNFEPTLKSVQEGDTETVFAVGQGMAQTPQQQFDWLMDQLINAGKAQFVSYRRLKW